MTPTPPSFRGTFTALVTPFTSELRVDYNALEKLVEDQIEAGVEGIVVMGTTGESPTVTHEEHKEIVRFVADQVDGRTLVIAGTGSNSTEECLEYSFDAAQHRVDALLIVNPYYNKPTQEGLRQHFYTIAEQIDIPQILYNIKGRTGVNIELDTLLELAQHKNIVGVKEASGDIGQMMDVLQETSEDFAVLSGDDNLTYPLLTLGGDGVVSVLSNVIPAQIKEMVDHALSGDFNDAVQLHYQLMPLMKACFVETNPIPVKTMLALQGRIEEYFRLPMCGLSDINRQYVHGLLAQYELV